MPRKPAAGGGHWVEVAPERVERWLREFDRHHGVTKTVISQSSIRYEASDGFVADCYPLLPLSAPDATREGFLLEELLHHAVKDRVVGVLLVRRGGFAAGVFDGKDSLASRAGRRLVHGRNKAGGWSQQRFARRREGQTRNLVEAAIENAERILVPYALQWSALVCGGDKALVEQVLADSRLKQINRARSERFLSVGDPTRAVLLNTPALFQAISIRVFEQSSES